VAAEEQKSHPDLNFTLNMIKGLFDLDLDLDFDFFCIRGPKGWRRGF